MSDSKVFMFPDGNNSSNGLDPNLLLAMSGGNGFGGGLNAMWVLFLFFLYPLMRNGGFWANDGSNGNCCGGHNFGPLANLINNNDGRQLLDAAINRNGASIDKLAGMFGCKTDTIISAINNMQSAMAQYANQTNMNISDVKYAISSGNQTITSQLASCCCDIREAITAGNYQNQLQTVQQTNQLQQAINGVSTGQERGFSSVAYETQRQTCDIKGAIKDLSTQMSTQFGELATRALQDKLDAEREKNTALVNQLSNEHQTIAFNNAIASATAQTGAQIAAIKQEVGDIKCKLPETVTVPYQPFVTVPNCVAYNTFGLNPFNVANGGSIWS